MRLSPDPVAEPGAGRCARSWGHLVLGVGVGQGALLLAMPLLTRCYSREDFGSFAVFAGLCSILGAIGGMRYEFAIPIAANDPEAASVARVAAGAALVSASALALVLAVLGLVAPAAVATLLPWPAAWLLPPGVALFALFQLGSYWHLRQQRYRPLAIGRAAQGLVAALVQVLLGLVWPSPLTLALGIVAGHAAALACVAPALCGALTRIDGPNWRSALRRFQRFPLYMTGSALLNTIGLQVPLLVMKPWFGAVAAGEFLIAHRLLAAPVQLLGEAAGQVFHGEAARRQRENPGALVGFTIHTAWRLALLAAAMAAASWLLLPYVYRLFGAGWQDSAAMCAVMVPAFALQLVASPLSGLFSTCERQRTALGWNLARLILVVAGLACPLLWGSRQGLTATGCYAGAQSLAYAALLGILLHIARRSRPRQLDASPGGDAA